MAEYVCKPHEEKFPVHPVGVKYRCEFCNEGEMIKIGTAELPEIIDAKKELGPVLFNHRCTICGKTMKLPTMYPKIEWEPVEEGTVEVMD